MANATLRRKQARQAARAILPNATETRIVVTGNYRAWRHFIAMRATEHADVEIRELAVECLRQLQREVAQRVRRLRDRHPGGRLRDRVQPVRHRGVMLDHERIRHSRRTLLGVLLPSALPWSVFLLAGVDYYPLDAVAILLPVLVAVLVLVVLVVAARRRDPRWLVPAVSLLVVGLLAVGIRWLPADAGAVRPDARVSVLGANVGASTTSW